MKKNKYVESFRKQATALLAEDIDERKKVSFDVNVMDSLKEDEYEIGENILEEYWREYKGILHDVLVKLVPANLDPSYEFSNVDQAYGFSIVVKGDHTVTVSYYIHNLIYKAYNESADVIEAEGAIINSIEEHLGGSSEDPEMEDEDLAALLNDPELNNVEESTKLAESDSKWKVYAENDEYGYYLDKNGDQYMIDFDKGEKYPENAYLSSEEEVQNAILKFLIRAASALLKDKRAGGLDVLMNYYTIERGNYRNGQFENAHTITSVAEYLKNI